MHRYKLQPPYFTGDYATCEELKHKMVAYLGLQDSEFPRLLQTAETSNMEVADALLRDGAATPQEAQLWVQLSRDLRYILVSVCSGQAAALCRQHSTQAQGLETWRQLRNRFSIPVGTRSVGYLTKLLKPQFNEQKFEESFATWEFEIAQYESDNKAPIPDNIKIAVLLNETKGALQQYLQLRAGTIQRYVDVRELILEYHRASTAFSKMQALQQAPTQVQVQQTTTNGHRPDVPRKRKAQVQRKEIQRTKQRKDTMAQQRKSIHRIQQQWVWQRQSTNTNWLRQCVESIRIRTSQRKDKK